MQAYAKEKTVARGAILEIFFKLAYYYMSTKSTENSSFDSIESAIADIAAGKMVIVTDDESRENEGDLVMAASKVTAELLIKCFFTHVG